MHEIETGIVSTTGAGELIVGHPVQLKQAAIAGLPGCAKIRATGGA
jgi:hypothetical protein